MNEQNQPKNSAKTFIDSYFKLPTETFEFFTRSTDICMKMYNTWLESSDILSKQKPESKELPNSWTKEFEEIYNDIFESLFRPMNIISGRPFEFDLMKWPNLLGMLGDQNAWIKPYERLMSLIPKEVPQLFSKLVNAYINFYTSWNQYYSVLHKAWQVTSEQFSKEFIQKTVNSQNTDEKPLEFWDFYNSWEETYTKTYTQLLCSPEMVSVQTKLSSSIMDIIKNWRDLLEAIINTSPSFPLATKSEMDEVYKRIHVLRKDMDELTKKIEKQNTPNQKSSEK